MKIKREDWDIASQHRIVNLIVTLPYWYRRFSPTNLSFFIGFDDNFRPASKMFLADSYGLKVDAQLHWQGWHQVSVDVNPGLGWLQEGGHLQSRGVFKERKRGRRRCLLGSNVGFSPKRKGVLTLEVLWMFQIVNF